METGGESGGYRDWESRSRASCLLRGNRIFPFFRRIPIAGAPGQASVMWTCPECTAMQQLIAYPASVFRWISRQAPDVAEELRPATNEERIGKFGPQPEPHLSPVNSSPARSDSKRQPSARYTEVSEQGSGGGFSARPRPASTGREEDEFASGGDWHYWRQRFVFDAGTHGDTRGEGGDALRRCL